jgi:hypothetical protein
VRNAAKLSDEQTEEVGVIKPSLQYLRAELAENPIKAEQPSRVGHAAPDAEGSELDPGLNYR